ncbi:Syntaxin-binding protein 4 [Holothuria leucospilota]|uniref:Syntaxin-binding protein 4 n=1 Tax=Holothuria leucospilota TaxID=206669 RepID=A0A9Q1BKH3_HOLLE|nr:Syntaxin-binding protein 4 [Holothuria leucospilota]
MSVTPAVTLTDAEISALESSPHTSSKGSPQHMQDTETVVFRDCRSGLGVKIIGGINEDSDGRDHGIFIKRILPGGRAAERGNLKEGDQLLSVNGKSLMGVTNEQAVQYLRQASATDQVTLVVSRNSGVSERYNALLNSKLMEMSQGSPLTSGNSSHNASSENISTDAGSTTPRNDGTSSEASSVSQAPIRIYPQELVIAKSAGLGISIAGGINRPGSGSIVITDMIPGGDCQKDGRLHHGDVLLSVNGESLEGITHEAAKSVLTRISLSRDIKTVVIRYIPSGRQSKTAKSGNQSNLYGYPSGSSHSSPNTTDVTKSRENSVPHRTPEGSEMKAQTRSHDNASLPGQTSSEDQNRNGGDVSENSDVERRLPQINSNHQPPMSPIAGSQALPNNGTNMTLPRPSSVGATLNNDTHPNRSPGDGGDLINGKAERHTLPFPSRISPQVQVTSVQNNPQFGTPRNQPPMKSHTLPASSLPPHMQRFMQPNMHSTPQQASTAAPSLPSYQQMAFLNPNMQSTPLTAGRQGFPAGPQPSLAHISPVGLAQQNLHHQSNFDLQATLSSRSPTPSPQSRRLSIDPSLRLKVEKLQVALEYLGLELTEEQKQQLRSHLHIDGDGMVQYGEFVSVAKQLFKMNLNDTKLRDVPMTSHDMVDLAEPPAFKQNIPVMPATVTIPFAELETLRRERDEAVQEARRCRSILQERERSFNRAEEELLRVRKDAQGAIHESRALKSRVHLAEAAQKEARNMEMDYEEVVRLLEQEIAELRVQLKERPPPKKEQGESVESLRKRLAVLGGEIRKAETSKKTFEVATERLMQFAEFVHDYVVEGPNAKHLGAKGETARRGQNGTYHPPGYLSRHRKKGPVDLASEAKEVVKAVKALIEVEPLPYGWEETYTKDGARFYTNHVTQTTTWVHPISNIDHSHTVGQRLKDLPETVT